MKKIGDYVMSEEKCPKCGGKTKEGTIPGAPWWKPGKGLFGFKKNRLLAYRCEQCGYIELYAK